MLSHAELLAEYERVAGVASSQRVSNADALAALEAFRKLDADPDEKEAAVVAIEQTMEWRSMVDRAPAR